MIIEDVKIPTGTHPIEAFTISATAKPEKAFLVLPGRGYTIHHFLLDFLWRMAAETGLYSVKAEYRGYTYRHLDEPYDHHHATEDVGYILAYLANLGFPPENIIVCAKSLGTIALVNILANRKLNLTKAILLTPVLYYKKETGIFSTWADYNNKVKKSYIVFGGDDPYCDLETAQTTFPHAWIDCYPGADHGLHLNEDYAGTIKIQREIIEKAKKFILSPDK